MLCHAAGRQDAELATPDTDVAGGKVRRVLKKGLRTYAVCEKAKFKESLGRIGMESMTFGGEVIDLSYPARKTVEVVHNTHDKTKKTFQEQLKDCEEAEKDYREKVKHSLQAVEGSGEQLSEREMEELAWLKHNSTQRKAAAGSDPDADSAKTGEETRKRGWSSGKADEGVIRSKRRRFRVEQRCSPEQGQY